MKVTVELLRNPVPLMVSVCAAAPAASEPGDNVTMAGTGLLVGATVTDAVPDLVESCVDAAVTVAAPVVAGVKTPALLTAPMLAGLTDHVAAWLGFPVPVTVAAQADV